MFIALFATESTRTPGVLIKVELLNYFAILNKTDNSCIDCYTIYIYIFIIFKISCAYIHISCHIYEKQWFSGLCYNPFAAMCMQ